MLLLATNMLQFLSLKCFNIRVSQDLYTYFNKPGARGQDSNGIQVHYADRSVSECE